MSALVSNVANGIYFSDELNLFELSNYSGDLSISFESLSLSNYSIVSMSRGLISAIMSIVVKF